MKKMWSFPPSAHSNWYEMNMEMIEKYDKKHLFFSDEVSKCTVCKMDICIDKN